MFSALAVPYYIGHSVPEFRVEGIPLLTPSVPAGDAMQRMTGIFDQLAAWVAKHVPALVQAPTAWRRSASWPGSSEPDSIRI